MPVRVGLFHEADLPFRIHFCGFGNCVTPRRRGGAFQQRSVLIQIRTRPLNFRSAAIRSAMVRRAKRNQQRNRLRKVSQPLTSRCDSNRKAQHFATKNPKEYDLFLKGEYAFDRAWKSGGFPLSYFLSRMGDPMSSGVFLKK